MEKAVEMREKQLKDLENLARSLPVNLAEMNDAEIQAYILEHYQVNFDEVPPLKFLTPEEEHYLSIDRFVEDMINVMANS
jgi:hypothetical protein